jgi:putative phosphonate metabolism protein
MSSARYAIYFTPPPDSPLAAFGAGVIGYDCFERSAVPHRSIEGIDPAVLALATVEPRRYGFHATLMAPFHLADSTDEGALANAFSAFASSRVPIAVGLLRIAAMNRFVVLSPVEPHPAIEGLADACLAAFDPYRAPLNDADRARRVAAGLSPRQAELLERWGYPYVLDEFRFHMTLAGPIPDDARAAFKAGLSRAFNGLSRDHLELGAISLMRQDDQAGRFYVLERMRLSGRA